MIKIIPQWLILLVCAMNISTTVAQTEKGKFLIGAQSTMDFKFNKNEIKSNDAFLDGKELLRTTRWQFAPKVGYFIKKNLAIGLITSLVYEKVTTYNTSISDASFNKTAAIISEPFVEYYFTDNKLKPFLNARMGIGRYWREYEDYYVGFDGDEIETFSSKSKQSVFSYALNVGIAYFVSSNLALQCELGYSSLRSKEQNDNDDNTVVTSQGIESSFGFLIIL